MQADIMLAVTLRSSFVPADHPIRRIKPIVDAAWPGSRRSSTAWYSKRGRPSIRPKPTCSMRAC